MGYTISVRKKGMVIQFTGQVSGDDFLSVQNTIFSSENFDGMSYVINDLSQAELEDEFFKEIEVIAAISMAARLSNSKYKKAFVVKDKSNKERISKAYFEMGHSNHAIGVFETQSEAEFFVDSDHNSVALSHRLS